jgi:hypothetical protein
MPQTDTQNKKVLSELLKGERPTHRMAVHLWGIDRLSARIYDLKDRGWSIDKVWKKNAHNRGMHAEYYLVRCCANCHHLIPPMKDEVDPSVTNRMVCGAIPQDYSDLKATGSSTPNECPTYKPNTHGQPR